MPAAVRYIWMFRTAASIFVLWGLAWLWTFGLTSYHPEQRPVGLIGGVLSLVIGFYLFRRARFAIAISAIAATIVCLGSVLWVPLVRGPGILFLGVLAILTAIYAVLSARVLFGHADRAPGS
jgi:hypothetical protein